MEINKKIEGIKSIFYSIGDECSGWISFDKMLEIIALLERGDKFEKMWDMLEQCTTSNDLLHMNGEDFRSTREFIKDKYFYKGGE